ncbi:MAG: hypothetical protein KAG34_11870 [Cocleimonas sp.]|nr:hypothetical protein [Cocleimonas sp.]
MSEIQFRIPDQQPELEAAITQFIAEEFKQKVTFTKEPINNDIQKGDFVDIIWQGIILITVLESSLQFADRLKRMERVKKLLEAIKKSGKAVYFKIGKNGKVMDLSKKSADETIDLLTKKDKEK